MAKKEESTSRVVDLLIETGWIADGVTLVEEVRIPTMRSPVFGGCGGEVRKFGGRARFIRGEDRVTVGPRTVNFYRVQGGQPGPFTQFKTADLEGIKRHLRGEQ